MVGDYAEGDFPLPLHPRGVGGNEMDHADRRDSFNL